MKMTQDHIRGFLSSEPFVLFRLPGSDTAELWLQKDNEIYPGNDYGIDGFYLHPLDSKKHPVVVIPRDRTNIIRFPLDQWSMPGPAPLPDPVGGTGAEEHQALVQKAIDSIGNGSLKKVVVAAYRDLPAEAWNPVATFMRLALLYPRSFVFLWHHPEHTGILGSTPEILVDLDEHFGLTYSLAGTKTGDRPWTDKEKEEQKIVTDYIIRRLLSRGWTLSRNGPYDHAQGHLIHLRTDIRFILNKPGELPKVLRALHPTPAVAGMPKDEALEWITANEPFDRRYYTGFLGLKTDNQASFFVNLRSLEFNKERLRLFAGGGITAGSRPADEWEEVNQKMNILSGHLIYNDKD